MKKKSDELIELSEKDFSFLCSLKTGDMTAINGGYFCDSCEKKVHDVSSMTKDEYRQFLSKTENICVTFKKVVTVSLVLGMAACSSAAKTQVPLLGKIKVPNPSCNVDNNKTKSSNSLSPYTAVDKNQTVYIEGNKTMELGGDIVYEEPTIDESSISEENLY